MLLLLAILGLGTPDGAQAPVSVRAVTATRTATGVVVTVQLSRAVKASTPRLIENPFRLYFDLPGVVPGRQRQVSVDAGSVSHVRVGLNKAAPPVTRVVIELGSRLKWRLEPGATPAEMRIVLEDAAAAVPAATPPGGRLIFEPAPAAPPVRDRREQITSDLFQMSGALEEMRAWTGPPDAALAELIAAAERLSVGARAMQISGSARDVAIVAAIDGVLAAARARALALADGSPQSRANAIAAATGASLLLRHAQQQK